MSTKVSWIVLIIAAFGSAISFFHINSAYADAHNANGWFIGIGIGLAVVAIGLLAKVAKAWK